MWGEKFKRYRLCFFIGFLSLLLPIVVLSQNVIKVEHKISGVDNEKVLDRLNQVLSDGSALHKKLATNISQIRSRAKSDVDTLQKVLRSVGYYGAKIGVSIDTEVQRRAVVTYDVDIGEQFLVKDIFVGVDRDMRLPEIKMLPIKLNEPLIADVVLDAQKYLVEWIEKENCLAAVVVQRRVTVDHLKHSAVVDFDVVNARDALFGDAFFKGLTSIEEDFLRTKLPWKEGDCFKPSLVSKAALKFQRLNFFTQVDTEFSEIPDVSGHIPVTFHLHERRHRTIKTGVSINSDEGVGVGVGWEHRNIFGRGQKLSVEADVSRLFEMINVTYFQPIFKRMDQHLVASSQLSKEMVDAYDATSWRSKVLVNRKLKNGWRVGTGPAFHYTDIEDDTDDETFGLLGWIFQLQRDTRDEVLNPKKGYVVHTETSPFIDTFGNHTQFVRTRVEGSTYLGFGADSSHVLALRGMTGSIVGSGNGALPKNERFFAGGGGSVRGYGFQELGDFESGDPVGGRSVIEASVEGRFKLTKSTGLVAFLDGGNVYESTTPEFDLRWAVGAGFRYYTEVFPIRFDVAVPLDKRDGIDDDYQFYISIGQAF